MKKEIFLHYPPKRDVVFVLGAGTSYPDGVPLQHHILPMILSNKIKEIKNSEIGKEVTDFINDNFDYQPTTNYPSLEAVFGFLDYFILQNESLNSNYSVTKIYQIKEHLIKLIHYIVNYQTEKKSKYYHYLWEAIKKHNSNISIITLNYDTLLEQAFDFLYKNFGYIDYCTHLMNFDKSDKLKNFRFWTNPREPIIVENDENPIPIKIIKLHGSLNWKYCNCCNQTLLTPWDRKIDLDYGKFLGYTYPDNVEYEYVCPLDGTEFQTLILPPTYLKSLNQPVFSQLVSEAGREIRATKKIVFIGYSLSDADIHIKALFQKQLNNSYEIIVCNTKNSETLKQRYRAFSNKIKFINRSFEDIVQDSKLLSYIFA